MNIIIAGDGKVGSTLTRQLVAEGHNITVIDFCCCDPNPFLPHHKVVAE